MKKLLLFLVLCTILLSACSHAPSVPKLDMIHSDETFDPLRLIGLPYDQIVSSWGVEAPSLSGSWGSTWVIDENTGSCIVLQFDSERFVADALFINEAPSKSPCNLRRMIMVNDVLYYSTNLHISLPDCGMSDGLIQASVEPYEYPTVHNSSNFGSTLGYFFRAYTSASELEVVVQAWDGTEFELFAPKHLLESDLHPSELGANSTEISIGIGSLEASVAVNENDTDFLLCLIETGTWDNSGCTDCATDYMINILGRVYHYHANCGTINAFNVSGLPNTTAQHKKLTPVQRACLNHLLNTYTTEK